MGWASCIKWREIGYVTVHEFAFVLLVSLMTCLTNVFTHAADVPVAKNGERHGECKGQIDVIKGQTWRNV